MSAMNELIAAINSISALLFAALFALCLRIMLRSSHLRYAALFLSFSFLLIFLINLSNILEYLGVTAAMDSYEEYFEVMFLPFILLFGYAWTSSYVIEKNTHYSMELQHRVKNNLQLVESILSLQQYSLKNTDGEKIVDSGRKRILSLGLAEHYLYNEGDFWRVNMNEYLGEITRRDTQISGGVARCDVECEAIYLNAETAAACGLVVNELLMLLSECPDDGFSPAKLCLKKTGENAYDLTFTAPGCKSLWQNEFSARLLDMFCMKLGKSSAEKTNSAFHLSFESETKEEMRWRLEK